MSVCIFSNNDNQQFIRSIMTRVFPGFTRYHINKCTSNIIVINSIFHWIQPRITSTQLINLIKSFLGFKPDDTFLWVKFRPHNRHTLYINQKVPDDLSFQAWLALQALRWTPSALSLKHDIHVFNDFINKNHDGIRYFCEYYDLKDIGEFIIRVLTQIKDVVLQKTRERDRQIYDKLIDLILTVITHSITGDNDDSPCDYLTDNPDLEALIYDFLFHNDVLPRADDGQMDFEGIDEYTAALAPEMTWLHNYYNDPTSTEYLGCCRGLIRRVLTRLSDNDSDNDPQKIIILRYKNGSIITIPDITMEGAAAQIPPTVHPKKTLLVYSQSGTGIDGNEIMTGLLRQRDENWNTIIELLRVHRFSISSREPDIQQPEVRPSMMIVIYVFTVSPDKLKSVKNLQSIPNKIAMFVSPVDFSGNITEQAQKESLEQAADDKGYTAVMFYTPSLFEGFNALEPLFTPPQNIITTTPPQNIITTTPPLTSEQQFTIILSMLMI